MGIVEGGEGGMAICPVLWYLWGFGLNSLGDPDKEIFMLGASAKGRG